MITASNYNKKVESDSLQTYYDQIKSKRLLTSEEELDLARRIEEGDGEARKQLINANLRLVVKIAKSFKTPEVPLLDMIQEGNLGLMKAAEKFDHRRKVRFSTYASWWIKQSIVRALSNKRRAIRLPHRKEEKLRKIKKVAQVLSQDLMREPEIAEIALEAGMNVGEVETILKASNTIVSLDGEADGNNGSLQELVEDYTFDPNKELEVKSLQEATMKSLDSLKEREKKIIMYRYSFYGGRKYTLKSIGAELGISPETVRQIEIKALRKLREHAENLREYCYNLN
jgi:RNA polymerase primary sigma factor